MTEDSFGKFEICTPQSVLTINKGRFSCYYLKVLSVDLKVCQYLRLHIKIIC